MLVQEAQEKAHRDIEELIQQQQQQLAAEIARQAERHSQAWLLAHVVLSSLHVVAGQVVLLRLYPLMQSC